MSSRAPTLEQAQLDELRMLSQQENWSLLEERSRNLLSDDSNHIDGLELLAYALQQQGQLEEAADLASKAVSISADRWFPNFIAGLSLKRLGNDTEAYSYLLQASKISPSDHQTRLLLTEATAAVDGLEQAALGYSAYCKAAGIQKEVIVAPILTVSDYAKKTGMPLLNAGDIENIPYKEPHVYGTPPAVDIITAPSNQPYVADLANVRIFNQSSIILTEDGTVLSDTGGHAKFGHAVSFAYENIVVAQEPYKLLLNIGGYQTRELEAGILMSGLASNAYGHWIPEFLPKLQFLQQHPDYKELPVIIDAGMPQSHTDLLKHLCDNPLITLENNESISCKRLLVAPSPTFLPVEFLPNDIPIHEMPGISPKALRFIQEKANTLTNSRPTRHIFLARKNMQWRRLINEDEIIEDLSTLGFEAIYLEDMSTREQIELFQQAKTIVAPNGSALLNVIFSSTEVNVLILAQPNLFNWGTYQGPMDELGYKSICVCGKYAVSESDKHSNYWVDKHLIRQALADIEVTKRPISQANNSTLLYAAANKSVS